MKLQVLESPDSDKRAKSYTRTKIGSEIAIRNNRGKSEKKKTDRTLHDSSEPVIDTPENPNDISICDTETQSGDET